jgi:hypothetical protein
MVNYLKGSWNLALFCEGWFLAQPGVTNLLEEAMIGLPSLNTARNQLFPGTYRYPVWQPLTGLPEPATSYVFAGAGGTLIAGSTKEDEPRLWAADARVGAPVFRELLFDTNALQSSWYQWTKQITSLASWWSNGVPHLYAGTSAGIMEVNPAPGVTNALSPFVFWNWDASAGLRRAGDNLIWSVLNFGSNSGFHAWTKAEQFIHVGNYTIISNQIVSTATGEVFGWQDVRGYIWFGSNAPPILFSTAGYSTNGAVTWSNYLDGVGNVLQAQRVEAWDASPILLVNQADGQLLLGGEGQPFRPMNCPTNFATTLFFDEDTGLVIAGGGSTLFYTRLPNLSAPGMFTDMRRENGNFRLVFAGRSGNFHRIEYSSDLLHWTPFSTNTVQASGSLQVVDSTAPAPQTRFYRAVLLRSAP